MTHIDYNGSAVKMEGKPVEACSHFTQLYSERAYSVCHRLLWDISDPQGADSVLRLTFIKEIILWMKRKQQRENKPLKDFWFKHWFREIIKSLEGHGFIFYCVITQLLAFKSVKCVVTELLTKGRNFIVQNVSVESGGDHTDAASCQLYIRNWFW